MKADTLTEMAFALLPQLVRGLAAIVLSCFVAGFGAKEAVADEKAWAALQEGGAFALMRHGTAEPHNDPLALSPGNCTHERNLSDRGRQEATRMGEAFRRLGISVTDVLASPYCRTIDTARLAFGSATPWDPLTLNIGVAERTLEDWTKAIERRIRRGAGSGNVVMVTHRPNIEALTMELIAPAELVVVKADEDGDLEVIGRITLTDVP